MHQFMYLGFDGEYWGLVVFRGLPWSFVVSRVLTWSFMVLRGLTRKGGKQMRAVASCGRRQKPESSLSGLFIGEIKRKSRTRLLNS